MPITYSLTIRDRLTLARKALDEYEVAMAVPKIRTARIAAFNLLEHAVFFGHASGVVPNPLSGATIDDVLGAFTVYTRCERPSEFTSKE